MCVLFEVEQKRWGKSIFTRVFLTERWKVPVKESKLCFINMIYIYIYAFSRRFYPKRLTIAFRLYIFYQYVCSLGIEPTTFCAANTMLYHWATQEHIYICDCHVYYSVLWLSECNMQVLYGPYIFFIQYKCCLWPTISFYESHTLFSVLYVLIVSRSLRSQSRSDSHYSSAGCQILSDDYATVIINKAVSVTYVQHNKTRTLSL